MDVLYEGKKIIKRVSYLVNRVSHEQGVKKNIYLFTTKRGGSTWLTQLITANPGIRYIDHALSYYNADFHERSILPEAFMGQFLKKDPEIKKYLHSLENGDIITKTEWNPFREDFLQKSNRLVFKITEAKSLMNWLYEEMEGYFIYQLRHPIPTALSIMKLGWGLTAEAYLKNEEFKKTYLNDSLINLSYKILNSQSQLDKYVLNWVLENLAPLKSKYIKKWNVVSYEEMVIHPEKVISHLSEQLELPAVNKMLQKVNTPSNSSKLSSSSKRKIIQQEEDRILLLTKWREEVSAEQERRVMDILNQFDVRIYEFGQNQINRKYFESIN